MSASKYLKRLTGKYTFFSFRRGITRCVSSNSSQKINTKLLLSTPCLSKELSIYFPPSISYQIQHIFSRYYSSQASSEEQIHNGSSLTHSNDQHIIFEDMLFDQPVPKEELLIALQNCKTLAEQMELFSSTMALSSEDIENRKKFCKVLELKIKPFFNDCKIEMFGSSINSFGFKGCDIDMTFETSIDPNEKVSSLENIDIPLVSEVVSGEVAVKELSKLPPEGKLLFIYNLLLEYYKESSKRIVFIKEVPLVRFYHEKFNLKCELTSNNRIALDNGKLLYLYTKTDKRVAPFVRNIQGWARNAELTGKRLALNSYSINLLAIYFLQTRSPPVIPSAESLLTLKNFKSADIDDDNFLDLLKSIPPSNNTKPLDELLREFFLYYLFFDFTRVICPLTGTSIPRKEYISKKGSKFAVNTLCIEDPLCTSNNTARLAESKMFLKLYSEIISVCKMFQDGVIATPSSSEWGLVNIFNTPTHYHFKNADVRKPVHFTLPCISKSINDRNSLSVESFKEMSRTLLKVVEHALLFECGSPLEKSEIFEILDRQDKMMAEQKLPKNVNMPSKTMVEHFKKVNAENELILCCKCKISKNVWTGREFIKLDPSNLQLDLLNQENLKSKMLAEQNDKNNTSKDQKKMYFSYLLECYVASKSPNPSTLIYFRPLPKQLNFAYFLKLSTIGIFLKNYLPNLMKSSEIE